MQRLKVCVARRGDEWSEHTKRHSETETRERERERESFRDLFLSLPIAFCLRLSLLLLVKWSVVGSVLFFPVFFSSLALLCTCLNV